MKMIRCTKVKTLFILVILAAMFIGVFCFWGPTILSDSDQYIKMHIHREPLYPLFLWMLRLLFGEGYLTAMGILQCILTAVSIWVFAEYICKKFSLYFWEEVIVLVLLLFPYILTCVFSLTNLFITNSVMSEGLSMPLFLLFFVKCFDMLTKEKEKEIVKAASWSLFWALLLALTRSQMMAIVLVWFVAVVVKVLIVKAGLRRKFLRLALVLGVLILTFGLRSVLVKSYNKVFNGYFINNTNGSVHMLVNVLYASDKADGENIQNEEAKALFYQMYAMTEENRANYKYAGKTLTDKFIHLEKWHNAINFDMVEAPLREYYRETVTDDYIIQDILSDETAKKIIKGILPECIGQWFLDYLTLAAFGLVRSIAVVNPLCNWAAVLLYFFAVVLAIFTLRQGWKQNKKIGNEVWLMGLVLLTIFANVFAVSIVIMPISRYMVYGFSPFYIACFVLVIHQIRMWKEKRTKS